MPLNVEAWMESLICIKMHWKHSRSKTSALYLHLLSPKCNVLLQKKQKYTKRKQQKVVISFLYMLLMTSMYDADLSLTSLDSFLTSCLKILQRTINTVKDWTEMVMLWWLFWCSGKGKMHVIL